jgi:predicted dehydrogenase
MDIQWECGAVGGYASTYALKQGIQGSSGLRIVAEDGLAEVDWHGCRWITPDGQLEWGGQRGDSERDLSLAMFHAITDDDPMILRQSYEDALRTHRLVMAANQSAETGTSIAISDSGLEPVSQGEA